MIPLIIFGIRAHLFKKISTDNLPEINGDRPQLEQLFQNLLSNAIKFRRPGVNQEIHITYTFVRNDSLPQLSDTLRSSLYYHRIDVSDNGIGFDPDNAQCIFQVFQRLHGRSEYAETGIGLSICEKVVANHGGAILATGLVGRGSTFTIFLPA